MKTLASLVDAYKTICTVGNAKNAGKTTVLNYLINNYKDRQIAITSIGLDGEKLDQITILPKPRIFVYKNMIVATACECLKEFEAKYTVIEDTNIMSSLGFIKIVRIEEAGNCLVAGPTTISQTKYLIKLLEKYNLEKVLIDGAFSKTAFSIVSDAIIYCVGASYAKVLSKIIRDTKLKVKLYSLPKFIDTINLEEIRSIALIDNFNRIQLLNDNSTLNSGMDIIKQIKDDTKYIYIPKAVSKSFVDAFIKNRNKLNCDIILNNPTSLIIDEELLNNLFLLKNKVYVLNLVNLVAIAYNPYSPSGYSFNNDEFKNELKVNINLPIFNVLEER